MDIKSIAKRHQNISFPVSLVASDNKTDQGYFTWIKAPQGDGRLLLNNTAEHTHKLEDSSLIEKIEEVQEWYVCQQVDSH